MSHLGTRPENIAILFKTGFRLYFKSQWGSNGTTTQIWRLK